MSAKTVLLAALRPDDLVPLESPLAGEAYTLVRAVGRAETLAAVAGREPQVVLLVLPGTEPEEARLVSDVRAARTNPAMQIVVVSPRGGQGRPRVAVDAGADDFLLAPFDAEELGARARAASLRWDAQATLVKEREFFRLAVAEEERLSSLVLDQNQSLKEAYEKIRRLNEELEKANAELERIAAYDSLSGLLNRRSLFARLGIEIERSIRLDVPLTGLMVDIDRFKAINDNFGHQCGDGVLQGIGRRLSEGLRKYDYAGRYGGEEFFVVLSNTSEHQALSIGERFRRDVEECRFTCSGEEISVTVSIGVARYRTGESQESWIERADRAMYGAKQAGRNRIVSG